MIRFYPLSPYGSTGPKNTAQVQTRAQLLSSVACPEEGEARAGCASLAAVGLEARRSRPAPPAEADDALSSRFVILFHSFVFSCARRRGGFFQRL